jgi:hypothetical protein
MPNRGVVIFHQGMSGSVMGLKIAIDIMLPFLFAGIKGL